MLNRNAEALFWVGRYTERAENHARLIDVHYHIQQEKDGENGGEKWARLIDALGARNDYLLRYEAFTEKDVLSFLVLDTENVNSLRSCVSGARSNLRTLREMLPTELWDVLNGFYLWLGDQQVEQLLESPHGFFKRTKEWMAMFQGAEHSVMLRENEFHFMESGRFLERAENTLRILQSVSLAISEDNAAPYPYLLAVLKSVSGYQAFRRFYADAMAMESIVEFLLRSEVFPRSVFFSFDALETHLKGIELEEQGRSLPHDKAIRLSWKVKADLACMEKEDIDLSGFAGVLGDLMRAAQQIGHAMAGGFFRREEATA
ncbi:alpha-E domain-containing protein [Paenibacillus hamazuiensis]|uniref:alpha-E domain-containing protein n=1 Tax=Paenibacillus hamazuiensis TaxID=2936508 RepID=UPI00200C69B8|nr:alpha-E domain-containing protein [Paenibacillus hamazuiensis]